MRVTFFFFVAICKACVSAASLRHMLRVARLLTHPALLPALTVLTHLGLRNEKAILCPDLGSHTAYVSHVSEGGGSPNPQVFSGDSYAFGRSPSGSSQDHRSALTIPTQGGVENGGMASGPTSLCPSFISA